MLMIPSREARVEKGLAMRSSVLSNIHSQERIVSKGIRDLRDQQLPMFRSKTKYLLNNRLKSTTRITKSLDRVAKAQDLCLLNLHPKDRVAGKAILVPWQVRMLRDKLREEPLP